jgi:hypothetical protein
VKTIASQAITSAIDATSAYTYSQSASGIARIRRKKAVSLLRRST